MTAFEFWDVMVPKASRESTCCQFRKRDSCRVNDAHDGSRVRGCAARIEKVWLAQLMAHSFVLVYSRRSLISPLEACAAEHSLRETHVR